MENTDFAFFAPARQKNRIRAVFFRPARWRIRTLVRQLGEWTDRPLPQADGVLGVNGAVKESEENTEKFLEALHSKAKELSTVQKNASRLSFYAKFWKKDGQATNAVSRPGITTVSQQQQ